MTGDNVEQYRKLADLFVFWEEYFMPFNIKRPYRHLQRYRQISEILLKNGLGFLVDRLDLAKYLPFKRRFNKEEKLDKKSLARRFRLVLQELGPTYIKLGQVLSVRADILPPAYIDELRHLQDKVPPVPFPRIREVLIQELGKDYGDYFLELDSEPTAAASIAQTHHGVLNDGSDVILKVQRPGIEETVRVDLEIIKSLITSAEERDLFPEYIKPSNLVKEFAETLNQELNFQREAANIKRFTKNFRNDKDIIVPRVYDRLSTRRLLVMEEIKGVRLSEIEQVDQAAIGPLNRPYLARLGARALMKQVLIDGFFHADPHPGNIFVVGKNKLAYVDFGMMGRLTPEDRDNLTLLFLALLNREPGITMDILLEMGFTTGEINTRKFRLEIQHLFDRYYGIELKRVDLMEVTDDIQRILYNFHVRLPEEFFLLFRAIGVSEGVGYSLYPSFDLVEVGQNFVRKLFLERFKPDNLAARGLNQLWGLRKLFKGLPSRVNEIFAKLADDEFTVVFRHVGLENLINKLDIISNRLSISIIITALIIGSSMILQTEMQPLIFGIPLLGFIGYSVAGIMGFWLVISILRSGRF